eukprot:TRINITY_DN1951_c0_g1_i3.p1 TRINITY_DN1951_c0_g1~~TRINITY_DN1951_c0_g1_i3.p1  ORF type:complete len:125 (-),score=24.05 TRINITY_DN1951_c0_g1_i3:41-415(-)
MCAVFAESEVVGLVNAGARTEDIALAVHCSVARRLTSLYKRLGVDPCDVAFVGGGALNVGLVAQLRRELCLGDNVLCVPERPQLTVALGAALIAFENATGRRCDEVAPERGGRAPPDTSCNKCF